MRYRKRRWDTKNGDKYGKWRGMKTIIVIKKRNKKMEGDAERVKNEVPEEAIGHKKMNKYGKWKGIKTAIIESRK